MDWIRAGESCNNEAVGSSDPTFNFVICNFFILSPNNNKIKIEFFFMTPHDLLDLG